MTDDLVKLAIISGVAGTTAKELVSGTVDLAKMWLADHFNSHHKKAIETADNRAWKFVALLSRRVDRLERMNSNRDETIQRLEHALDSPEFSISLQSAVIASSLTDDKDKHELLARAVSDKLIAPEESLLALSIAIAIQTIAHLSPKHLRFLGLAALIEGIRPSNESIPIDESVRDIYLRQWWLQVVGYHHPPPIMLPQDYRHLAAMSCLTREPHTRPDHLSHLLAETGIRPMDWGVQDFLANTVEGAALANLWEVGMRDYRLLSIGTVLGIYVHDLCVGMDTDLSLWASSPWGVEQ
jgi:hypothetical protein